MNQPYKFALADCSFTMWDRIRVSAHILNPWKQLTQGPVVEKLEKVVSEYAGAESIFVSSGSTANHLIFETYKQSISKEEFRNTCLILPTTTWASSISPGIMANYDCRFSDVNLTDFCFDYDKLDKLCGDLSGQGKSLVIFATALIGKVPDFDRLNQICAKWKAKLFIDCCEAGACRVGSQSILAQGLASSDSTYFSHFKTSIEGGFVTSKDPDFIRSAKQIRSHGMSRTLSPDDPFRQKMERENPNIDKMFLFSKIGSNFRNTEINALFGLFEQARLPKYIDKRQELFQVFWENLDPSLYKTVYYQYGKDCPFCLPFQVKTPGGLAKVKAALEKNSIASRGLIGGHLGVHPAYKDIIVGDFPNSQTIQDTFLYVGLNTKFRKDDVKFIAGVLNKA